ncbi:hypothetical protein ACEPAI_4848 [Sanghuangporus weigelae]
MATAAPDVLIAPASTIASTSDDSHLHVQSMQSPGAHDQSSTPFPVSSGDLEDSVRTVREQRLRRSESVRERNRVPSSSSSRSRPRSVLVSTDLTVQVTAAAKAQSQDASAESDSSSSPSSSESESQSLRVDDSSRTTLSSSCSTSGFGPDSAASSTRTRATTLSAPCVTFAPLPEIGPRKRKSNRPLGIAARGQILRQRRMMIAQDNLSYYDDHPHNTIPGGEKVSGKYKDDNEKNRRDDLEDTEIAIAALGKVLGEATKAFWQRVARSKAKAKDGNDSHDAANSSEGRPRTSRSFAWGGRLRSKSKSSTGRSGNNSGDDSEDEIDGPWTRRRDEDPMTKTIMEGSDDGLENFVLAYDTIPACEEEEEEFANAQADEEMRTTVEVHLVKVTEGDSED